MRFPIGEADPVEPLLRDRFGRPAGEYEVGPRREAVEPREQERHEDVPEVREEPESDRIAACAAPLCLCGKAPA